MCDIRHQTITARADVSTLGNRMRVDAGMYTYASLHAKRTKGTATTAVLTFLRSNTEDAAGVAYGSPVTLTLNADEVMVSAIDVRDQAYLFVDVTTVGSGSEFDLFMSLSDRQ